MIFGQGAGIQPRLGRARAPAVAMMLAALVACGPGEESSTPTPGEDATPTPTEAPTPTAAPTPTPTAAPTPTPVPDGEGTLALRFRLNPDVEPLLREDPIGPFLGDIFYSADVTNLGPRQGAEVLGSIFVEEVDLTGEGAVTGVLYTTGLLPNSDVTILGFLNSDDEVQGQEDADGPDRFDPVTFPADNSFRVIADQETEVEVYFGMLNP